MIEINLDQGNVGGPTEQVLANAGTGGVYCVVYSYQVTPGVGASGIVDICLAWTDANGQARTFNQSEFVNVSVYRDYSFNLTLENPGSLEASLSPQTQSGNFDVQLRYYVARVKEEGC